MTQLHIPDASANRLRVAYAHFEELAATVMEAMGVDQAKVQQFDLKSGTITLFEEGDQAAAPNGVAQEATA